MDGEAAYVREKKGGGIRGELHTNRAHMSKTAGNYGTEIQRYEAPRTPRNARRGQTCGE